MLKQTLAISLMNIKNLPQRFWSSLVIVIGMTCVIGVLLSLMSFSEGISIAYDGGGDPDTGLVMSLQAPAENNSSLPRGDFPLVADAPGIARDASGKPLVEAEAMIVVPIVNKQTHGTSNMIIRGFGPQSLAIRPKFHIIAGRNFRPGARELVVGHGAQGVFEGLALGDKMILPDGQWPIVGIFATDGGLTESSMAADRDTLMTADRKLNYNTIRARMTSLAAFETFRRAVTTNPALQVNVERDSIYYHRRIAQQAAFYGLMSYSVGVVMAIGAMFGALNTMYAAVASRTREIGTLRALGFGSGPVVISVLSESMLLALIGALMGAALAWSFFNGNARAIGSAVFHLSVTPQLLLTGLIWGLAVGMVGGLFPAIRAARLPVATAIRAT